MSNYRNGWQRPMWRGGAPGRELTRYEEKVLHEPPFFNTRAGVECKPTNRELGYSLTGMEEEGPSPMQAFSDKYTRVHDKKYEPIVLRPRKYKNRYETYTSAYPEGTGLQKPRTMEEAGKTTCVFYPDQPNLLLKVCFVPEPPGVSYMPCSALSVFCYWWQFRPFFTNSQKRKQHTMINPALTGRPVGSPEPCWPPVCPATPGRRPSRPQRGHCLVRLAGQSPHVRRADSQ